MRTLVIILIIVLAAIAVSLLMKPASAPPGVTATPASAPALRQAATTPRPVAPPATPAPPELRAAAATGVVADLHTAANYATGHTPLKVKQSTQKKIHAIQDQHNQDLEQALK